KKIELLVRSGDDELLALVGLALGLDRAVPGEDLVALLAPERRIGQHLMPFSAGIGRERVGTDDRTFAISDAVQVEVHGRETHDARNYVVTGEGLALELRRHALVHGARVGLHVLVGLEQEAAGSAGGVAYRLTRL